MIYEKPNKKDLARATPYIRAEPAAIRILADAVGVHQCVALEPRNATV